MTLVITGANGTLGKKIVSELEALDAAFSIVARTSAVNGSHRAFVVPGGYDDVDALRQAFAGATGVFLMSTPDMPEVRIRRHRNAIDAAADAGVEHVVFLSLHDSVPGSPFPFAAANHDAEVYLQERIPQWTILSPNIYAEAIEAQAGRTIAQTDALDLPFGSGRAAHVTRRDIAAVVAAVCTSEGHTNRRYEITGPQSHSGEEIATMLSEILARQIAYRPLTEAQYVNGLIAMGLPETTARAFFGLSSAIAQDRFDVVATTVRDLTGREPTALFEHLRSSKEMFGQKS